MDPRPDPPPIYHQIPPAPQRKRKGKGTFVKVSTSTSSRKTSNYRIRKLGDGRLGQQRADSVLVRDAVPEPRRVSNEDVDMSDAHGVAEDIRPTEPTPDKKKEKRKAKPDTWADRVREFLPCRELYLDEILRLEGLGDKRETTCSSCNSSNGIYRCRSCLYPSLSCRRCMLAAHNVLPLHRIEVWTGKYFAKTSLKALGLKLQLGHGGGPCLNRGRRNSKLLVGDLNGFHEVDIRFCDCPYSSGSTIYKWQQLLQMGWFAASQKRPNTVFTFDLLNMLHQLSQQAKTSLYDFHKTMWRVTDNSVNMPMNRYKQLSTVFRFWRHLMMLKRAGRGHDPSGIDGTQCGELGVECPACPHPTKNLPTNWHESPSDIIWLYTLFLMVDANFKLRLKDKGISDQHLAPGWAYFVEDNKFQAYLEKHSEYKTESNTCSAEHKAILNANMSKEGYLASGVAAVLCARHALVRPSGVGDLQKGERYINIDYLIISTLVGGFLVILFISYDIACQYSKNFRKRIDNNLSEEMEIPSLQVQINWAIPKKHIAVHGPNHSKYSFNFLCGVGRTYGEGIESGWSHMNPISMSTKEMGPALRQEVLNDHWGSWNWTKILNFGDHLGKSLREAYLMQNKHQQIFQEYNATFPANLTKTWGECVDKWNKDHTSKPDPYEDVENHTSLKEVRLKLAIEDSQDITSGVVISHEVTSSSFINLGLELEEQQRNLASKNAGSKSTSELATLQEKRNVLAHRISNWQKIQDLYMPLVAPLRQPVDQGETHEQPPQTNAESIKLFLPSACPVSMQTSSGFKALTSKEIKLRIAQAYDAIASIRKLRRILASISEFKRQNVSGTGNRANTRIRTLYDKFQKRIKLAAARYHAAHSALLSLDPRGPWQIHLKVLHDDDIRGPGNDSDLPYQSEGRREPSWIWLVSGVANVTSETNQEMMDAMRVEWAKTQARGQRWSEEVKLLQEEMRRVLVYFAWKADWWRSQRDRKREYVDSATYHGIKAYAEKQASVFERLAQSFAIKWSKVLKKHDLRASWQAKYEKLPKLTNMWKLVGNIQDDSTASDSSSNYLDDSAEDEGNTSSEEEDEGDEGEEEEEEEEVHMDEE